MSLIVELLIGAGVGFLVSLVRSGRSWKGEVCAGAVGAVILASLYSVLSAAPASDYYISLTGLLLSVLGALLAVLIWRLIKTFALGRYKK